MLESWLSRFRQRDRVALSRLLSFVMRGERSAEILAALGPPEKTARVVALTGSGGVGKSTLVGKLIERLRGKGQSVAVLACDPQSPLSGGALLGDRFRMPSRPDDDGIFIRSLAAVSGHGAVADHLGDMVRLLEVFGFDAVVIETVGAGQGDTAVRDLADVLVLLLQPETGDDLQWEKAGVLEVADIVVVNKADLPGADEVEQQVRMALSLLGDVDVKILRVSARTGAGLDELVATINTCPSRRTAARTEGRDLLRLLQEEALKRFATLEASKDGRLTRLLDEWRHGTLVTQGAVTELWRLLREPD